MEFRIFSVFFSLHSQRHYINNFSLYTYIFLKIMWDTVFVIDGVTTNRKTLKFVKR